MYFHQLQPAPLDLPEITDRIRADLTLADIRKCVLVSSNWNKTFWPFLWETMYYNRFAERQKDSKNDPFLRRNGQLVRKLFTFGLDDQDMITIAKYCSGLTFFHLEIARMTETYSFRDLFTRLNRLQQLVLRVSNAHGRSPVQRAILDPIANGALAQLTELQIIGLASFQTLPAYQSGMLLRCLEGCPLLKTLELGYIRVVDTEQEWLDALNNAFSFVERSRRDLNKSAPLQAAVVKELQSLNTTPDPEFKNLSVRVLRLWNVYGQSTIAGAFACNLIQRCPNVTVLSFKDAPVDMDTLTTGCPQLEFFKLDLLSYPGTPAYQRFITQPPPKLQRLCLRGCQMLTDAMMTEDLTTILTQQGLRCLEMALCEGISAEGLVRFVARCHTLENVWVDRLLVNPGSFHEQKRWPSRSRGDHMGDPSESLAGCRIVESIRWRCLGIRYLDVYGIRGDQNSFENVLLDLLPRLEGLNFLGMRTEHVEWLMEMEPLRDRHGTVIDLKSDSHLPAALKEGLLPRLVVMFGSIKTLSLDPTDRRGDSYSDRTDIQRNSRSSYKRSVILTLEQVMYLHYMFPTLERIVYNGSTFPCAQNAWDWLSVSEAVSVQEQHIKPNQGRRTIKVLYRSQEETDAALWEY
ncbi:hypothetical protein EMPS_00283 [Entomortierella parvispora]|uniref:F-box domain-containing protein n=1 Tax=Entomortierella parvispora TaxID=205924 RepID=A0A9P3H1E8_9FUNG|nr:hypothetical protein EMPS_00283 [Entomortierella parvispora]